MSLRLPRRPDRATLNEFSIEKHLPSVVLPLGHVIHPLNHPLDHRFAISVEMGNCRRVNSSARSGMLRSACSYSNILTRTARFRAFPLGRTIRRRFPAPSDTSVPSRNNCRNAASTVPWLHPSSFANRSRPGKNSRQRASSIPSRSCSTT